MTKAADQTDHKRKRRGLGRKVIVSLALLTAVGGFGIGMVAGPLVTTPNGGVDGARVVQMDAGTFPVALSGAATQMIAANVSIRTDGGAPDGLGPLRDAMFALLTEAAALPLVLDGRTALPELEKVVMSMAQGSAPWLVALDLEPSTLSTAALAGTEKDPVATGS